MKKRYEKDPEVSTEESEICGLHGEKLKYTKIASKTMQFTSLNILPGEGEHKVQNDRIALDWQSFRELGPDHGLGLVYSVLDEAGFGLAGGYTTEKLLSDIKDEIPENSWLVFERHYAALENFARDKGCSEIFVVASWAQLFAEPFGEFWLAAMAQHAYWVEEDEYAFGYLIALLDQKRQNEEHYLRGIKNLASASQGGRTRSKRQKAKTEAIIDQMKGLIEAGHSVSNAASIVAKKRGFGTSSEANRKLWNRRGEK